MFNDFFFIDGHGDDILSTSTYYRCDAIILMACCLLSFGISNVILAGYKFKDLHLVAGRTRGLPLEYLEKPVLQHKGQDRNLVLKEVVVRNGGGGTDFSVNFD
jgi:hypothetical protein